MHIKIFVIYKVLSIILHTKLCFMKSHLDTLTSRALPYAFYTLFFSRKLLCPCLLFEFQFVFQQALLDSRGCTFSGARVGLKSIGL